MPTKSYAATIKAFRSNLKRQRAALGLSQEEVAERLGIATRHYQKIESGELNSPDWVDDDGVLYLSAKCVKNNYLVLGDAGRISARQHGANPRTAARAGDVVVTTVGTIGNAAVIEPSVLPANMDRHVGIIRIRSSAQGEIDPYYLATFLNSNLGRFQTIREATGNVQLNLFIEKIEKLRIPIAPDWQRISALSKESYKRRSSAAAAMREADGQVAELLEVEITNLRPMISYEAKVSIVKNARRMDAEYYQPAKREAVKLLAKRCQHALDHYYSARRSLYREASGQPELIRNFDLTDALTPVLDDTK